jgi:large subunit ribosomal protein L25
VQHNPLGGAVLHVDFHAVSQNEVLHASVTIEALGEAAGVKSYGGILEQNIRSLEIECLPKDLPELISVDVSNLNIGDSIHVKDIKLPEGVSAMVDENLTVFHVAAPTVEEEKPAAEAPTAPEVIKEKKPEGAEAAAPAAKAGDKKPADKK